MNEVALIRGACENDRNSFNCLVETYQDIAYTLAYRLIGEERAAANVTQGAFTSAYSNLRSFRGGSFQAWLLRIVTKGCYDEIRWQQHQPSNSLLSIDLGDKKDESPGWMSDPRNPPESSVERTEQSYDIQHHLQCLPEVFRAVVILVDILGLNYAEAAQVLGKPMGTIKSHLAYARMGLSDSLHNVKELMPAEYCQKNELVELAF